MQWRMATAKEGACVCECVCVFGVFAPAGVAVVKFSTQPLRFSAVTMRAVLRTVERGVFDWIGTGVL